MIFKKNTQATNNNARKKYPQKHTLHESIFEFTQSDKSAIPESTDSNQNFESKPPNCY
jgi:hypothetical protein